MQDAERERVSSENWKLLERNRDLFQTKCKNRIIYEHGNVTPLRYLYS